jgi:hypothetical protein
MKPILIVAAMTGVLLAMASPSLAQRSEAGDRGVRLETNALLTDVRRERLKKPAARSSAAVKAKRRVKVD